MAWVNPKLDWVSNPKNPKSEDMNRIEGNIDFLKTDIETKKGEVVSAINDMGQTSTISDSYATLGSKIKSISSDASATIAQVLVGATFYQGGVKKTGTMVNQGNITTSLAINGTYTIPQGYHGGAGKVSQAITTKSAQTFTPSTINQTISAGQYLSGAQTISGSANLVAGNIKRNVNVFGVVGSYATNITAFHMINISSATTSVTIPSVNYNSSVLIKTDCNNRSILSYPSSGVANVTAGVYTTGLLIEFDPASVKYSTKFTLTTDADGQKIYTKTIPAVNTAKTLVIVNSTAMMYAGTQGEHLMTDLREVTLTSTLLSLKVYKVSYPSSWHTSFFCQIIEFY